MLADTFKSASLLDGLFELVEIQRSFVHAREASETVAMLLVEFGELIQIIKIGTCACWQISMDLAKRRTRIHTSLNRVQLLFSRAKMETLLHVSWVQDGGYQCP